LITSYLIWSRNLSKPEESLSYRLPAIACDIDGVILRGSLIIGNSDKMIKQILTPREGGVTLPFTLLTNGGGFTEERKAEEINKKLHLEESPY
jgi:ribonucleotide monophosphatase NagD (HAD superfamily)